MVPLIDDYRIRFVRQLIGLVGAYLDHNYAFFRATQQRLEFFAAVEDVIRKAGSL